MFLCCPQFLLPFVCKFANTEQKKNIVIAAACNEKYKRKSRPTQPENSKFTEGNSASFLKVD